MPIPTAQSSTPSGIKRARAQLSCAPCRTGKLKCNRSRPACDQCIKRNKDATCHYLEPPKKQTQDLRGRIKHLESMVVELINTNGTQNGTENQPSPPDSNKSSDLSEGGRGERDLGGTFEHGISRFGQMKIGHDNGGNTSYVGGSHWQAILDELTEVKADLGGDGDDGSEGEGEEQKGEEYPLNYDEKMHSRLRLPKPKEKPSTSPSTGMYKSLPFFAGARMMSKKESLEALPPKNEIDALLNTWWNSGDPFLPIIHRPTFQEEYKSFLASPSRTPLMWLSLLFGALAIGTCLGARSAGQGSNFFNPDPKIAETVDRYHGLAASALCTADFSEPKAYTIEALCLYAEVDYLRRSMGQMKNLLLVGMTIRLSQRMGYHRDPSHYPSISPFHGEMRRRKWNLIVQIDALLSFLVGLPSQLRLDQCDTKLPSNLLDEDFSVDSKELPAARPPTEITPCSYPIAKSRVIQAFGESADLSHAVKTPTYSEILSVDARLLSAHAAIPPPLRVKPLSESITDCPQQIMNRFNIELCFLKSRCILHRRYITSVDPAYAQSRRICIEAAMKLLSFHIEIYTACQPGGPLAQVRWYMSSLTTHDFVLAAMLVCLELNAEITVAEQDRAASAVRDSEAQAALQNEYEAFFGRRAAGSCYTNKDLIKTLRLSHEIWRQIEFRPPEVEKASNALKVMMDKLCKKAPNKLLLTETQKMLRENGLEAPGTSAAMRTQTQTQTQTSALSDMTTPPSFALTGGFDTYRRNGTTGMSASVVQEQAEERAQQDSQPKPARTPFAFAAAAADVNMTANVDLSLNKDTPPTYFSHLGPLFSDFSDTPNLDFASAHNTNTPQTQSSSTQPSYTPNQGAGLVWPASLSLNGGMSMDGVPAPDMMGNPGLPDMTPPNGTDSTGSGSVFDQTPDLSSLDFLNTLDQPMPDVDWSMFDNQINGAEIFPQQTNPEWRPSSGPFGMASMFDVDYSSGTGMGGAQDETNRGNREGENDATAQTGFWGPAFGGVPMGLGPWSGMKSRW